jgi:hypothetical protein
MTRPFPIRSLVGAIEAGVDRVVIDRPPKPPAESLAECVSRAKAKWLKRVMYHPATTSTERCFAYVVCDHLNAASLDCWPSQERVIKLLGFKAVKTISRVAAKLERRGLLKVTRIGVGCRYAPVFNSDEQDITVPSSGHPNPPSTDANVRESLLPIQSKSSARVAASERRGVGEYEPKQRGAVEMKVAALLGVDGVDLLFRLSQLDPAIIDRLCRAYSLGALGERELSAIRLAAEQVMI